MEKVLLAPQRHLESSRKPAARSLRVHAGALRPGSGRVNRLAFIQVDVDELLDVLHGAEPRESGAFFLLRAGRGTLGRRLLAADPIFPLGDVWEAQQEDQLRPSAQWISSAISKAVTEHSGLLFVHSHPDPGHPIGFSPADRSSITSLAQTIAPMLEGPF